jgi:hypothetical protein
MESILEITFKVERKDPIRDKESVVIENNKNFEPRIPWKKKKNN